MNINNLRRNMLGYMIPFHEHKYIKEKKKEIGYFFSYKMY